MAHLQMMPIGSELPETQPVFLKELNDKDQTLDQKRHETQQGWGDKYKDRVHAKGKLTSHERILKIADTPKDIMPIGTFVNDGDILEESVAGPPRLQGSLRHL